MLLSKSFQALIAQLRTSIILSLKVQKFQRTAHYTANGYENDSFYTGRQYYGQKRSQTSSSSTSIKEQPKAKAGEKACFVCCREVFYVARRTYEINGRF